MGSAAMKKSIDYMQEFDARGFTVIPDVLDSQLVPILREELCKAIAEDTIEYPHVFDTGMVHNLMIRGPELANILSNCAMEEFVAKVLGETYILYAYQSSSLPPGEGNYGTRIHVDSPRFIADYCTNVGVIFPLDDFTEENGATYVLPGSHKQEAPDNLDRFDEHCVRVVCNKGDMIVFHGRTWHRAGNNQTDTARHAITLNMCRSYMRQRFDFARMLPGEFIAGQSEQAKRLIGMSVRVPSSLHEFYLPEHERLYKANQG